MNSKTLCFAALIAVVFVSAAIADQTVVLNFDDLPTQSYDFLPFNYGGLTWDNYHNLGYPLESRTWCWKSESADPPYSQPHSGDNYLFPGWGVNNLGFALPEARNQLAGAWFAKDHFEASGNVRFNGFDSAHHLIQQSNWLNVTDTPQYLAADFSSVARIEVESQGVLFFTMDDLTYTVPEPGSMVLLLSCGACLFAFGWRKMKNG